VDHQDWDGTFVQGTLVDKMHVGLLDRRGEVIPLVDVFLSF